MTKYALPGVALTALMVVGVAQAEPLTLSGDQMDQVTAAGYGFVDFDVNFDKNKNERVNIKFQKLARVAVDVNIRGYLADAQSGADCFAFNCTAETNSFTEVDSFGVNSKHGIPSAVSFAESVTAADSFFGRGGRPMHDGGPKREPIK